MLADSLNRFIAQEYGIEARHEAAYGEAGFSVQRWRQLAEMGAVGALLPEEAGGLGGQGFDIAVVFECLGRGLVPDPFLGALMVGRALAASGTPAQKEWLAGLIDGSVVAALAHDEPEGHYELERVQTRAVREGQGWVLSGRKAVVPHGQHAHCLLVSARMAGALDDPQGICLFLVSGDAPGLQRRGYGRIDGGSAAELTLNQVRLGDEALLGPVGQGLSLLEEAQGCGILALCAEAVGAMNVARESTLDYLRTRQQFGRPIGSFQALQHRMVDLVLEIEQARSAMINAAATLEADRLTRERALSAAKFTIGRVGHRVAEECIQLHGGIGMTWELPLSHYAKRLVMIDHQLGDEDHHLARYMALGARD